MSKLLTEKETLKTVLNSKLDDSFTIYDDWEAEGYNSPYIVIVDSYNISDQDTTGRSKRIAYSFDILIGKDFGSCRTGYTGEDEKEFLRLELEKIFGLSYKISGNIFIYQGSNNTNNTRASEFTLTKY